MAITMRVGSILLALAVTMSAVACTTTPAPSPTITSVSPTPSPTVTTMSPAEQDLENAKQAVIDLWAVVDRLTNDTEASLQDLDTVATGNALTLFQQNLVKYRAAGWTGSGSSVVEDPRAESSGMDAQGRSRWTVTACVDGSNTTLLDGGGRSVQGPPYRINHKATVEKHASAFLVSEDEAVGTC